MPKRILLFSDGTGNSSAKAQKTNVWRLFQAVDMTAGDQVAFYDDGVGTSSNRYLAMLGGAFGWGLKRNVIDLYKFVCRNYEDGDEISGFGFSRGAFTIRVLVGLVTHEGIVKYRSEEELYRLARAAYRTYRAKRFRTKSPIVNGLRWLRDKTLRGYGWLRGLDPYSPSMNIKKVPIRFLGLWDTVGAYGIPIYALKRAVNAALWPMLFEDLILSERVERACHALSLDDARKTFHPVVWDEHGEAKLVADGKVSSGRLTQVWFAGVHSNVGGGYPEDRLSYVPLRWIMSEASAAGIRLIPDSVQRVAAEKSPYARLYDSRAGFATFYRYQPRRIRVAKNVDGHPILPIIDGSVILRMADGPDRYAPVTLPDKFWVMQPSGTLLPLGVANGTVATPSLAPVPQQDTPANLSEGNAVVAKAVGSIQMPATGALDIAQDTVWWQRVVYLVMLSFAALLVSLPLYQSKFPDSINQEGCRDFSSISQILGADVVTFLVRTTSYLLPAISTPWTRAFGAHPDAFGILLILV